MARISFVSGMVGDTLRGVTSDGWCSLEAADAIVFPGDWIGCKLRRLFGSRLVFGRELTVDRVVSTFDAVDSGVMLYAGDARIYTGRPGAFPAAADLARRLRAEGHQVQWNPGCSIATLALDAAGLAVDVDAGDSLALPPALNVASKVGSLFRSFARLDSVLVLLWAEDSSAKSLSVLIEERGADCRAIVVSRLGFEDERVTKSDLRKLTEGAVEISSPATVIVLRKTQG